MTADLGDVPHCGVLDPTRLLECWSPIDHDGPHAWDLSLGADDLVALAGALTDRMRVAQTYLEEAQARRDAAITAARDAGASLAALAEVTGLSRERIRRIGMA